MGSIVHTWALAVYSTVENQVKITCKNPRNTRVHIRVYTVQEVISLRVLVRGIQSNYLKTDPRKLELALEGPNLRIWPRSYTTQRRSKLDNAPARSIGTRRYTRQKSGRPEPELTQTPRHNDLLEDTQHRPTGQQEATVVTQCASKSPANHQH